MPGRQDAVVASQMDAGKRKRWPEESQHQPPTLEAIAKHAALSVRTLNRRFRAHQHDAAPVAAPGLRPLHAAPAGDDRAFGRCKAIAGRSASPLASTEPDVPPACLWRPGGIACVPCRPRS
jgi:hypothetical protein